MLCPFEVSGVHDAAALEVFHELVPGVSHSVLVRGGGVMLLQGGRQKAFCFVVNVAFLVHDGQDNNCDLHGTRKELSANYSYPNLHAEDEDDEDAVSCEQDSRLLDGAAVSEEAEYEDEGTECDQDVGGIVNMNRRNKRLQSELV